VRRIVYEGAPLACVAGRVRLAGHSIESLVSPSAARWSARVWQRLWEVDDSSRMRRLPKREARASAKFS
jgi:hypothetical protein